MNGHGWLDLISTGVTIANFRKCKRYRTTCMDVSAVFTDGLNKDANKRRKQLWDGAGNELAVMRGQSQFGRIQP